MTYLFHIAFKYLFSINRQNVVNIITIVSVVGVLIGTAAMIIVLSIFNGFDDIIKTLYKINNRPKCLHYWSMRDGFENSNLFTTFLCQTSPKVFIVVLERLQQNPRDELPFELIRV